MGLHGAGNLLNAAKVDAANPVAAMPSLHSAYALIVVAFFLPTVRKRWWPLLLAYPLAMTFTLVYSGEHYMTDVLVGCVGLVLTAELFKSSIEAVYRGLPTDARERSGPGLAIGAAGVLMASLTAAAVGLLVLVPRLIERFQRAG